MSVSMSAVACSDKMNGKDHMTSKSMAETLKEHSGELMSLPGVVGTAQGLCDSDPCIEVYVIKKTPELEKQIPRTLDGYPVRVEETGEIRPILKDQN